MLLNKLLEKKVSEWVIQELQNDQSIIGRLIKYIELNGYLREPQIKAIKVYLWIKFVGNNQKLSNIVKDGLLYDDDIYSLDDEQRHFDTNASQFISRFIYEEQNNLLQKYIYDNRKILDFDAILDNLLHDFDYSNYLYSLPMGAGKTFLIASFIYLDLYFAKLFKDDKRFAHNFVVFAPQGSKTAILPSLKTIKTFNPEWILPKNEADFIRQDITIEILDALSSDRRDKLQGNNPNLEKVSRLKQQKDYGLIFITNAEKVVLEKYVDDDSLFVSMGIKEKNEVDKINELREALSQLNNLSVILDEVHHVYGKTNDKDEKKLRKAIDILNQHGHINQVIGVSGTPYAKSSVDIGDKKIKVNTIQDIVYYYPLNQGIGEFLKVPEIKSLDVKDNIFIETTLNDFFTNYDITYTNNTKSKIAFYCPNIEVLNTEILPIINKWYDKNRARNKDEIFIYYSSSKEYPLPKESTTIFHNLDKSYSKKRVILLVAIGTEGWDCKSLAAVALPREHSTKNFVLQTTCRCLREVDNAINEKALIYLSEHNYKTLDAQLKENYNISISDLKVENKNSIPVKVRKPELGKLKYKQVEEKCILINTSTISTIDALKTFDFDYYYSHYDYSKDIISSTIGSKGLTNTTKEELKINITYNKITFNDFLYKISNCLYGIIDEATIYKSYKTEITNIYNEIVNDTKNYKWLIQNPLLTLDNIITDISLFFTKKCKYKKDYITSDVEIELLEWNIQKDIEIADSNGKVYDLLPAIEKEDVRMYKRSPKFYEDDNFNKDNNIDPQDISFNYIPYKMDSKFEINALKEMLQRKEFEHLEIYYNGYKDSDLQSFQIKTPYGNYTPDFLILKRENKTISKILIIETKGSPYYESFKGKEKFIKNVFVKFNPNFSFYCIVDENGDNDFNRHINTIKDLIVKL